MQLRRALALMMVLVLAGCVDPYRFDRDDGPRNPKVLVMSSDADDGGGIVTVLSISNAPPGGMLWANVTFVGTANCGPMGVGEAAIVAGGDRVACSRNGAWNMVWYKFDDLGIVVAKGSFPTQ